jgi:dTDP-glucose 4,6-dehydratase
MAHAYWATFGLPVVVTRCCNNYGPYQYPEKLIPLFITNAVADKPLPVYGTGKNRRDWIHVSDHGRAVEAVLLAEPDRVEGEIFNISGGAELNVLEIADRILDALGKPRSLVRLVADRPGHDRRYAMDDTKLRSRLRFQPTISFDQGLADTVQWYLANREWWKRITSGAFREYYERTYGDR